MEETGGEGEEDGYEDDGEDDEEDDDAEAMPTTFSILGDSLVELDGGEDWPSERAPNMEGEHLRECGEKQDADRQNMADSEEYNESILEIEESGSEGSEDLCYGSKLLFS